MSYYSHYKQQNPGPMTEIIRTPEVPFHLGTWEVYVGGVFVGVGENEKCEPCYAAALALARRYRQQKTRCEPAVT